MEVFVPDLGDFSDVEVIEILVSEGDQIQKEDPLIMLETDKATMEVPSPAAGIVKKLKVTVGDRVSAGHNLLLLDKFVEKNAASENKNAELGSLNQSEVSIDIIEVLIPELGDFADVEVIEVLVSAGDHVQSEDPLITLETDKATMEVPSPAAGAVKTIHVSVGDRVSSGHNLLSLEVCNSTDKDLMTTMMPSVPDEESVLKDEISHGEFPSTEIDKKQHKTIPVAPVIDHASFSKAHAGPSVRKLARELGVDLAQVTGTGQKGRITAENVKAWVKNFLQRQGTKVSSLPSVVEVDFSSFGSIEVEPLTRIQKISGPRLQASWLNLPHVTQHDEADITQLENFRKKAQEGREIKITLLTFVIVACIRCLKEYPKFRSSLANDGKNLVKKNYFHIGFAADTPEGLVVPVIRNADQMTFYEIAASLEDLSQRAREGNLKSQELQGGVFTVSSLGGIGGTGFTPIINAPEVAILGVSRSQIKPVYKDGVFVPRLILPFALSYDHRVIDGAAAVRFTNYLSESLKSLNSSLED